VYGSSKKLFSLVATLEHKMHKMPQEFGGKMKAGKGSGTKGKDRREKIEKEGKR